MTATPTTPRPPIEALDVPLAEVEADVKLRQAYLLDELQQAIPLSDGPHAEQRHFLDADPDTKFPLPGIAHPETPGGQQ